MSFPGEKGAVFHEAWSSHRNEQRPSHGFSRAACGQAAGSFPLLARADTVSLRLTALIWKRRTTIHPPLGLIRRNIKLGAAVLRECLGPCTAMCFSVAFSYLSVTRLKEVLGSRTANLGDRGWLSALTPSTAYLARLHKKFHRCHSDHKILRK